MARRSRRSTASARRWRRARACSVPRASVQASAKAPSISAGARRRRCCASRQIGHRPIGGGAEHAGVPVRHQVRGVARRDRRTVAPGPSAAWSCAAAPRRRSGARPTTAPIRPTGRLRPGASATGLIRSCPRRRRLARRRRRTSRRRRVDVPPSPPAAATAAVAPRRARRLAWSSRGTGASAPARAGWPPARGCSATARPPPRR